ncbi:MAG: molybdate ABC transporter permease subunit, partial [Cyanobacteria bacterium J06555_3]
FSRAVAISATQIKAIDWGCTLDVIEPIPQSLAYVGIRAHQLVFADNDGINTFPCWIATVSETQHRLTLYLKLNQPANSPEDYHLQAEVFKARWQSLKDIPSPLKLKIDILQIMLLESNA